MTRSARGAALRATLVPAVLVLGLATAGLSRPDVAAADPPRVRLPATKPDAEKRVRRRRLSRGLRAVQIANRLTGIPYVWGGASPRSGFDCSGLVQYVYRKVGISLPHYTVSQFRRGRSVSRTNLRPGDLVFFYGLNHVGIYAGRGRYIHAPRSGSTVRWARLASTPSYYGARRIVAA